MASIKTPKKLIEVALPLDDINTAAAREKSIRHGHPSTLHLWWARRPLAAARAVLFAQMVNDPSYQRELGFGVNKKEAEIKREKLFQIIRELVKWENTNNEEVLNRAREAIWESWRETCHLNRNHPQANELFNPDVLPAAHDPFAGGGAIPVEAQRLGMTSFATDLNPVPVFLNKCLIEIPSKFSGSAPVGPTPPEESQQKIYEDWTEAKGLAEDVRRYGYILKKMAQDKIGHLFQDLEITDSLTEINPHLKEHIGEKLTVISWIWARTVKSPNPAFNNSEVPLCSSFVLATKSGKEVSIRPVVSGHSYTFKVTFGKSGDYENLKKGTKRGRGANFECLVSGSPISAEYVKTEASEGRMGVKLLAIVCQGKRGRIYVTPTESLEDHLKSAEPTWKPTFDLPRHPQYVGTLGYGITRFDQLFSNRQLLVLDTFSNEIKNIWKIVVDDCLKAGIQNNEETLESGGSDACSYADAVCAYMALAVDKLADRNSSLTSWANTREHARNTFGRQAYSMTWDFAECNPFSDASGNFMGGIKSIVEGLHSVRSNFQGVSQQDDAALQKVSRNKVVSTDPPYYDNVPYADLSDFFYIWLRRSIGDRFGQLFSTLLTPKMPELVADVKRHKGKENAENFFLEGMTSAMANICHESHPAFPTTIYYAFKQSETSDSKTGNTGWETFLQAVISAGFLIDGTWPMRTELGRRLRGSQSNALASSIVLVCRKRKPNAESISRRDFQRQLREEMPEALETMIGGQTGQTPIAPVDLAQAAIGPGMAIFSKYDAVLNQDGSKMNVHDALVLINRAITEYLSPDSGSFDADTQFCASWFDQYGWSAGPFGEADTLSRAKGTSVDGVREAGVVESGGGKVRLLKWSEYEADWDPTRDKRTPIWEACHQMIRRLNSQGESAAGELLAKMPDKGEPIRQLAYHLYTLCERKKWAEEARAYNELIGSWHAIVAASHEVGHAGEQHGLDF
ncbi:DUF1156 domain-containing protein [Microbulbifer guangxiensis]|uniref:DUF1156 domain-containing protein n=1 Tax=Microbulbifer guangxiensis TaxID=2904249 RepID=UPI001F199FFA|nr:DUF1156 domain-containing protein [Microbulbifer guangxiensis]